MKKFLNKRNIILLFSFIGILICMIISVSYAYYVINGDNENLSISASGNIPSCIGLSMTDNKDINVTGDYALPMKDSMLLNTTNTTITDNYKYSFTISNDCNKNSNVKIAFVPTENNTMPIEAIKYLIVPRGSSIKGKENEVKFVDRTDNKIRLSDQIVKDIKKSKNKTVSEGYRIESFTLNSNVTSNYDLYMWIDYYEGGDTNGSKNNTTINKTLEGLITIYDYENDGEIDTSNTNIHLVSGDGSNVGDKICIGGNDTSSTLNTQCFYVINNDGENIQMLAEYNLLVGYKDGNNTSQGSYSSSDTGYGLQNANAKGYVDGSDERIGTIAFSDDLYWYGNTTDYHIPEGGSKYYVYDDNSKTKQYVDNYVEYLEREYGIEAEGSLISYEQATALGCVEYDYCSDDYPWVYSASYWLGSANDIIGDSFWNVYSDGYFYHTYYNYGGDLGVRPVIKISTSLVS